MKDLEDERVRINQIKSSGYSAGWHGVRRPIYQRGNISRARNERQCGHGLPAVERVFIRESVREGAPAWLDAVTPFSLPTTLTELRPEFPYPSQKQKAV